MNGKGEFFYLRLDKNFWCSERRPRSVNFVHECSLLSDQCLQESNYYDKARLKCDLPLLQASLQQSISLEGVEQPVQKQAYF